MKVGSSARLKAAVAVDDLAHRLYQAVFFEPLGEDARRFFGHLGWTAVTFALAKGMTAAASVVGARLLGPEQYGLASLAVSAGGLLATIMLLGMHASIIKFGVGDGAARGLTTGLMVALVSLTVLGGVFWISRAPLAAALHLPADVYRWAWIYAALFSPALMVLSAQQALGLFGPRGWAELTGAASVALGLVLGWRLFGPRFEALTLAYALPGAAVVLVWGPRFRSRVQLRLFDPKRLRVIVSFGLYTLGTGIGFFLTTQVQRFVLNAYLDPRQVGLYSAYAVATLGLAAYAGTVFSTVFFPKAAVSTNRARLWQALTQAWAWAGFPLVAAFGVLGWLALSLMGRAAYPIEPSTLLLFASASAIMAAQNSFGQVVGAEGVRGARLGLIMSTTMGAVSLALTLALVPLWAVRGAVAAVALTYAFGLGWLWVVRQRYF